MGSTLVTNLVYLLMLIRYVLAQSDYYPEYGKSEPFFSFTPDTDVTTSLPRYNLWEEDPNAVYIPLADGTLSDCWHYMWWN
jgi:hypothetical protein